MIPRQVLKSFYNNNLVSSLCTQPEYQKSVQVSILGAGSRLGTYTSFLLKQNPLISALHLQGCLGVENIGNDLSHMDTSCAVHSYCGMDSGVEKAVKSADVVLILPTENLSADTPIGERIMKEGSRLHKVAVRCTLFAPRAILVVCVPPVSVTTPLVTEVFKKSNFYHPGRIIGSTAFAQGIEET
ncbi:malate dehydrogenase, mitochondrial-like [Sitophilus oryzae]|uniref:Malate dehydrogenase, mitochondrial n=1 Tax=Sitophilus oryzae TaxID=7048 RepID=A0A6J2XGH3_SITOR|nr:malate dehydrogenase, mitochondrial-like [Sitophilus oryzae]